MASRVNRVKDIDIQKVCGCDFRDCYGGLISYLRHGNSHFSVELPEVTSHQGVRSFLNGNASIGISLTPELVTMVEQIVTHVAQKLLEPHKEKLGLNKMDFVSFYFITDTGFKNPISDNSTLYMKLKENNNIMSKFIDLKCNKIPWISLERKKVKLIPYIVFDSVYVKEGKVSLGITLIQAIVTAIDEIEMIEINYQEQTLKELANI